MIAERNLIYLTPLLFVGTALVLERRSISLAATAVATAFALYLVATTPYALETYPNYETHGLAIAAFANRIPKWPAETIENILLLIALASGLTLLALRFLRGRVLVGIAATVAVFALAWSLTAEIYAANGERGASDQQFATLPEAGGLGRARDRPRAVGVRRPGHQRPEPVLAARVLEPVAEVGLGRGRQHARAASRRTCCGRTGRRIRPTWARSTPSRPRASRSRRLR